MASPEAVDFCVRRILCVTLNPQLATSGDASSPPTTYLAGLHQELKDEEPTSSAASGVLSGNPDLLDRVLLARLVQEPLQPYPQPTLAYLIGCYARATEQARSNAALQPAAMAAKDAVMNYVGLLLFAGIVPQEPQHEARALHLQLADALDLRCAASSGHVGPAGPEASAVPGMLEGTVPLPPGFLEELAAKYENDSLPDILVPLAKEMARRAGGVSALGDYARPLAALRALTASDALIRCLTSAKEWIPDMKAYGGRAILLSGSSWLGPFFNIGIVPDSLKGALAQQPSIAGALSGFKERRPGDISNLVTGLRLAAKGIQSQLHDVVKAILKAGPGPRAAMIRWFGAVLDGNEERLKLQVDYSKAAPHSFFLNVCAVLLRLCQPFLEPSAPLFWQRVDADFVADNGGLVSFTDTTRLAADSAEVAAWRERVVSGSSASSSTSSGGTAPAGTNLTAPPKDYHFICQCFFLTAKALHVGLVAATEDLVGGRDSLMLQLQDLDKQLAQLEELAASSPHPFQAQLLRSKLAELKGEYDGVAAMVTTLQGAILEPDFVEAWLSYYRLMAAWLLHLARTPTGAAASGTAPPGGLMDLSLPLPEPVPQQAACMPEYFLENMATMLKYVSRGAPHQLASWAPRGLGDTALALVAFMASPKHVRSAYLRSCVSEVLVLWVPDAEDDMAGGRGMRRRNPASDLSYLFQGHPAMIQHLVPALVVLYNDIEATERPGAFFYKFSMRRMLKDILAYLWTLPQHRAVWKAFAARNDFRGEHREYLRFANMLVNDAQYLLDESISKLKTVKSLELKMQDTSMGQQERMQTERTLDWEGNQLSAYLSDAVSVIDTMCFTTEEADLCRTFLLPEMVQRLADTLNYFLKYLTGPERKNLKIQNPDKYNFKPADLLKSLVTVYLHMGSADRDNVFVTAVGSDARSFRPDNFNEAISVLTNLGRMSPGEAASLGVLAQRALAAGAEAAGEDEDFDDAPAEYMDPFMSTLMKDPVMLPSSRVVMDRQYILRHLLTDQRDPTNRSPLTPEELIEMPELKAAIEAWVRERRARGRNASSTGGGDSGAVAGDGAVAMEM